MVFLMCEKRGGIKLARFAEHLNAELTRKPDKLYKKISKAVTTNFLFSRFDAIFTLESLVNSGAREMAN